MNQFPSLALPESAEGSDAAELRKVRGQAEEFQSEASAPQPARRGVNASEMHVYSHVVALFGKPGTKSVGSTGERRAGASDSAVAGSGQALGGGRVSSAYCGSRSPRLHSSPPVSGSFTSRTAARGRGGGNAADDERPTKSARSSRGNGVTTEGDTQWLAPAPLRPVSYITCTHGPFLLLFCSRSTVTSVPLARRTRSPAVKICAAIETEKKIPGGVAMRAATVRSDGTARARRGGARLARHTAERG